jgi:hypothetical protein
LARRGTLCSQQLPIFQGDNDKKNFERLTDAIKDSRKGKTLGIFSKVK